MSNPSKIKSKPYRNWVRGALGLFYLQKGLHPFTDRVVKTEHAKIVQHLMPCSSCAIENILPDHASSKVCIQKNKARCNCRKKTNTSCATCGKIYDDIVLRHRFQEPHWTTDCSKWYNDHWQFAKCFLTTTSKGSNNTAAETDASGLLSIIINGLFFQSELQCNIDPPNDLFSQVREIRNEILHNPTLDLTDHDVARYLQSMIDVLEDNKALGLDSAAQAAAKKLKEILNDELIITTNEEASAIQIALDAIKVAKEKSEDSIRKLGEEKQNALKASEERIRKLGEEKHNTLKASITEITEDSRNALQQQTSESAKEINTVKEQVIESVTSTVSTVFKETYEPEMRRLKLGHDDHENRIRAIEAEQLNSQLKQLELEKKVDKVEKHVAKLTIIEEIHQKRIEYLKQKQGLQQYLVDVYQQHYVRTSISPLLTQQNDVNIRDVYVSPRMEVEENKDSNDGNTSQDRKGRDVKNKHIERYRDLFSTRGKINRKIFILGDVGTGKSSFCKMMIQNWCTAITKRNYTDNSGATEEEDAKQGEEKNTCDLNQFDFLFYVPLREMSWHINDTVDMIKAQLVDYKVLIDDIFTNDSERILILADGLDEWTPPSLHRQPSLHPVTAGIPDSRSARASTIVTTSRPSSRGILNIKSSEYDLKVSLLGLNHTSVQPMIEKYMKLLNKTSAVSDFKGKLENLKLKDIQNAPLLLQQMIWLYCNNYEIGQSRSSIYLNIVNTVLGWEHERMGGDPKLHEFQNRDLEHLPLPKSFDKFVRCQENRKLLLLLGRLAYDAYITGSDSSLVFGRYKLKQLGVSHDGISALLRTGILTEVNSADPTYEKSPLSFIHTSYLEFFAALYICSYYLSKMTDAQSSGTPLTILESLIAVTSNTSVDEILRLENVLIMMCGLVPCLAEHVCECIYKISLGENTNLFVARHIEKLMFDCLSEHNSVDPETAVKFKQRCLYMHGFIYKVRLNKYLYGLDPTAIERCFISSFALSHKENSLSHEQCSLLSSCLSQAVSLQTLEIDRIECTKDECEGHIIDLSNHRKLQSIDVSNSQISVSGINHTCPVSCSILYCELSHDQCSLLSSYLSQALSLQTLEIYSIKCTKDECESHIIDLSNHRKLQSIDVLNSQISVSGINQTCPVTCCISDCELSHDQCSLLSSYLSQALSLQTLEIDSIKCTKDECESHIIDLSNHRKLQNIVISKSQISVSGINHTCPVSCSISGCELSHDQCSLLSSNLSQATSLETLEIEGIECTTYECEGHIIDLSNHRQLQCIVVSNSQISVSGINHTCPVTCCISGCELSHEQCSLLSSCLSQAVSLQTLQLRNINCPKDECDGHIIDLSNHTKLQSIVVSNSQISVSGINQTCPVSCRISDCELSHEQCSLLSSCLSQAVSLQTLQLRNINCPKDECDGHIIDLSNHRKLQSIVVSNSQISVSGINHTCPVSCSISDCKLSHDQCSLLSSYLSQAVSLQTLEIYFITCTKDECEGHIIDLSNHRKLQSIDVSNSQISVSGINHTCPVSCRISDCELSHDQCSLLSSYLSQATSLQTLEIEGIECTKDECESHIIDLSNHRQLQSIVVSNSQISVSGINQTCPVSCRISDCKLSHDQCSLLSSYLSQAVSLQTLEIDSIKCTKDECEGLIIDLSNHRKLQSIIVSNSQISVSGINHTCPVSCSILNCELSHDQCSLLSSYLSQATSLETLEIEGIECTKDECESHIIDLSNHRQLKSIVVSNSQISVSGINQTCPVSCRISDCKLSHDQCSLLSSYLSQATSLETLEIEGIECTKDECECHIIDLSNHRQLQSIVVSNSQISVSGINQTCPVSCRISDCKLSHDQCSLLSSYLSQATSLETLEIEGIECTKDECESHIIDLSNHRQLQSIVVSNSQISVSGINQTCPVSCRISDCKLSHDQCSLLSSYLSQAVSLQTLEINSIKCTKDECEGHIIDLSNHRQLQRIDLSNSQISVSGVNHTCPVSCTITDCVMSHEQCSLLASFLSQATSLQTLEINSITCTKDECEGHMIDLTNHRKLQCIEISGSTISVSGMHHTCLESCEIVDCKLSHEQCTSLSSCLSQATSLKLLKLKKLECTEPVCEGHYKDCHEIDLTNHNLLRQLSIEDCSTISINGINPTCPVWQCNINNCNLPHEQCAALCTFLSHAKYLRNITLREIKCTEDACEGHRIDITNHNRLRELSISNCNMISIIGINPTCPVRQCNINNCNLPHEQCAALCTFLSHAKYLRNITLREIKCTEDACEGHRIDLTNHNRLRELSISNCNMISIIGINPTCPVWQCNINNCNLPHEQCAALCTFLSHAKYLRNITLREIKCTEDACEGHRIDLTNHNRLRELSISNCNMISINGKNPTCPVRQCNISNCNLSHEQCTSLCTFLSHAIDLFAFNLSAIKCTNDRCEGHYIDLTNHEYLHKLSLYDCNDIYVTGR